MDRLARFVLAYLAHLRVEVVRVLDMGCGLGMWKNALSHLAPEVDYTGVEFSAYLCEKYGWTHATIASYRSRRKADLVVCQDVMQYLDDAEVADSIRNVARLCRGALYVEVPTREDIDDGCLDLSRTDDRIHVRPARWYRRRLDEYFISAGGGVFIPKKSDTVVLAMERA